MTAVTISEKFRIESMAVLGNARRNNAPSVGRKMIALSSKISLFMV